MSQKLDGLDKLQIVKLIVCLSLVKIMQAITYFAVVYCRCCCGDQTSLYRVIKMDVCK